MRNNVVAHDYRAKVLDEFPEDRWHANSFGDRDRRLLGRHAAVHSLKEKMTSEEQVGQEGGHIPAEFQRLVSAGEAVFPVHGPRESRTGTGEEKLLREASPPLPSLPSHSAGCTGRAWEARLKDFGRQSSILGIELFKKNPLRPSLFPSLFPFNCVEFRRMVSPPSSSLPFPSFRQILVLFPTRRLLTHVVSELERERASTRVSLYK